MTRCCTLLRSSAFCLRVTAILTLGLLSCSFHHPNSSSIKPASTLAAKRKKRAKKRHKFSLKQPRASACGFPEKINERKDVGGIVVDVLRFVKAGETKTHVFYLHVEGECLGVFEKTGPKGCGMKLIKFICNEKATASYGGKKESQGAMDGTRGIGYSDSGVPDPSPGAAWAFQSSSLGNLYRRDPSPSARLPDTRS